MQKGPVIVGSGGIRRFCLVKFAVGTVLLVVPCGARAGVVHGRVKFLQVGRVRLGGKEHPL